MTFNRFSEFDDGPHGKTICPVCGRTNILSVDDLGDELRCPDCNAVVDLPSDARLYHEDALDDVREYDLSELGGHVEADAAEAPRKKREPIKADPLPPPARWPFLIGLYSFPFYRDSMAVWLGLALGYLIAFELLVVCVLFLGGLGVIAMLVFLPVAIGVGILATAYAAACIIAIVEQTATGYDELRHWPPANWIEWFGSLKAPLVMAVVASVIGYGVGVLWPERAWELMAVTIYLLFPVFILSSLEANSATAVLSWPVVRSLVEVWYGWLQFYLITAAAALIGVQAIEAYLSERPFVAALAAAPALAAWLFFYARFLGRVAWRASHRERRDPFALG